MPAFPKWYNVNKDIRVWASHSDTHKQGWIYAPAAILALEEYKGSYLFSEAMVVGTGKLDYAISSGYPQTWVRIEDVSTEPYEPEPSPDPEPEPEPDPGPAPVEGDAELGAAVRTIVAFVASYFN